MAVRFGRKIRVVIDFVDGTSIEFDERLSIDFAVEKNFSATTEGLNSCEVSIANLNPDTKIRIGKIAPLSISDNPSRPYANLKLYAGYKNNNQSLLFDGKIINAPTDDKQGTEVYTRLYAYDNILQKSINESIKQLPLSTLIYSLATKVGIEASIDPTINRNFTGGSLRGSLQKVLSDLKSEFGFNYYVNNGVLFVTNSTPPVRPKKTIDQSNGLIGKPQITSTGSIINIMLDGGYEIGDFVKLKSDFADFNIGGLSFGTGVLIGNNLLNIGRKDFKELEGTYLVKKITHRGQSRGDMFETRLECQFPWIGGVQNG